ncbi:glycosyltransferase family 2 protein [Leptothermofonsia sp. ETS-13]|uniref:glycosyltransferase family 2 protein n=1 Tax=Leptothermofonsia sp. ETS-13 TaxID=3035696 RepID=UPI003BA28FAD
MNWNLRDRPLISVLLPFYNSEKYLETAIESILNQTCRQFELLLLDDGSTDCSFVIAQKYVLRDPRVQFYHHPNMGLCRTLQKGVGLAKGKYIARMDGDDIAEPKRFELQIEYLEQHPDCVALGTALTVIDPDGDVLCTPPITQEHDRIVRELLEWKGARICHPTVMMRTDAVRKAGGYTQEYHFEDVDLFLKLAKYGKLANLPERLLQYRWHIGSISHTRDQLRIQEIKQQIYQRAIANLQLSSDDDVDVKDFSSLNSKEPVQLNASPACDPQYEAYCRWCLTARKSGFYNTSFKYLSKLLKNYPMAPKTYWTALNFALGEQQGAVIWNSLISAKQKLLYVRQLMSRA